MASDASDKFMTYKGRPLVRCGNTLYYGNMSDPYVIVLTVKNTRKTGDLDVSQRIKVELQSTDENVNAKEKVIKSSEKIGLYQALDIASIWLDRA